MTIKLLTSNQEKKLQYQNLLNQYNINAKAYSGPDLREILGPDYLVAPYKVLDLGENHAADDTQLELKDVNLNPIEIKKTLKTLIQSPQITNVKAIERVWIAVLQNDICTLYLGETQGTWKYTDLAGGFGYNNFFWPEGTDKTMTELLQDNQKGWTARERAIQNWSLENFHMKIKRDDLPRWTKDWQEH